jgi:arylsulfatase A-like enzyme
MVAETGTAPGETPQPTASETEEGSRPERPVPATVLLLAVWIGLTTGFLDLGFVVLQQHLFGGEFYRLGHGFPWIIPAGVAALVLLPGAALALVAGLRLWSVPLGIAVGLTSFVGFLDLSARLPLELWSSLLLSAGLAVQSARLVGPRRRAFLRFARLTAPLLAGSVLAFALATSGARAWTEHRATAALPPPPPAARNVLLIVWDTVRAGNLSSYGYGRQTTPNLERLAVRGMRFEHAFATSSWTLPSHASLFTGRWPHELSAGWKTPLDDAHPTLAGRLGSLGYDTAGFVANLDYCGRESGLGRGFAHYEDYPLGVWEVFTRYLGLGRRIDPVSIAMVAEILTGRRWGAARPLTPLSKEHAKGAADVDRAFLNWLSWQRTRGRPFFAFLNYNDAHTPYEVPDDSARGFGIRPSSWHHRLVLQQWNLLDKVKLPYLEVQMANDLYDDSIAYLDRRLGALLDELGRRGVLEDTVVVVTSDHGEHLGDHLLFFHGCSLYRQLVEVPLVVVAPGKVPAGLAVEEPVSLRDLPATVFDLLGLEMGSEFPGRTLARSWDPGNGRNQPVFEPILMETERPDLLTNQGREPVAMGPMKSLVAGGMHYIRSGDGREELYALRPDPAEQFDLAGLPEADVSLEGFRGVLRSMFRKRPPDVGGTAVSVETPSKGDELTATPPTKVRPVGRPG